MAHLTVNDIPDTKLEFFKNLVKNLGYNYTESKEEKISIPKWQQEEVNKRYQDYKNNPEQALNLNDAIDQVEKKYGL